MLCRPDVGNDDIMLHWVETGLISFCLFLANWIILYLSAMAMFRMKKLHQHARNEQKAAKLAQFSKMVDDVEVCSQSLSMKSVVKLFIVIIGLK